MSGEADKRQTVVVNGVTITDTYLHMIRNSLGDLPAWCATARLPAGYGFRMFQPGDEEAWVKLHKAAEPFLDITDAHFQEQFGDKLDAVPARMFMVTTAAGDLVGSATAWWKDDWRESGDWGQVHWVVVHPAHQGRGLSKPLMARVLRHLAQDYQRAYLGTSTGRVWAIKVYLDCGFHPDPAELTDEGIRQAWRDVQRVLFHPLLAAWL